MIEKLNEDQLAARARALLSDEVLTDVIADQRKLYVEQMLFQSVQPEAVEQYRNKIWALDEFLGRLRALADAPGLLVQTATRGE